MDKIDTFTSRFNEALKMRNMRKTDIAAMAKLNRSSITQYTNGIYNPSSNTLCLFAEILNVSSLWLMGYDVPMEEIIPTNNNIGGLDPVVDAAWFRFSAQAKEDGIEPEDIELALDFIKRSKERYATPNE
jgi:transcriptional regulator with XRE-family HTH domain